MPGTKPLVQIKNINKFYGENHVVKDLSIDVQEGEFLTILGSSGSGKSTTLRMVAGFEQPTTGEILLAGTNVADKEPFERDVNTVFQSYALFPHMTIFDNVAYGLKMKKVPKDEIRERVMEMLDLVQLGGFEGRKPDQLSGGQKQPSPSPAPWSTDPRSCCSMSRWVRSISSCASRCSSSSSASSASSTSRSST